MVPGSISGRSTDIFQEGVRIPIIKLYDRGQPNDAALELLFANVRQPRDRQGDFRAQLATTHTAEERLTDVVRRFGADAVARGIDQILDRTEGRMRAQMAALPRGEYRFEDYMDSDGNDPDPVRICVRVAITDCGIEVDFAGSSPQRAGPVNASLAVASTSVFVTLKALLDPTGHINAGAFRPVTISAPPGTVVNAMYPAPMGGFTEIYRRVSGTLIGALSRSASARIAGDTKGTANHVYIGFLGDQGVRSIFYEYPAGGTGGFREHDGSNAVREWDTGDFNSIQSTELVEHEHPCIIERCELRTDSAGPGLHRGGFGMRRIVRVESERALFSVLSERNLFPPYGVMGGSPAKANRFYVERDGRALEPSPIPGKATGFPLRRGDRVVVLTAGGGGYGDPLDRDPALIEGDVAAGLVSEEQARRAYGVVVRDGRIFEDETRAQRAELRTRRTTLPIRRWSGHQNGEVVQVFRACASTLTKFGLAGGDFVEITSGQGAPIRGRLGECAEIPEGVLALGTASIAMLSVAEGAVVRVEKLASLSLE
jgi:N-methylhydantoinase B